MTDSSNDDLKDPIQPQDPGATPPGAEDDWASALAEQTAHNQSTQAAGLAQEDDWASALAEQTASQYTSASETATAADHVFQPLMGQNADGESDIDMIMDIPVQLSVELGRTRLTIKNILQLGQGSVVELDGLAGEPMDIYVNGYLIAQGEVVVVEDKYGIRVTDIITPSDRIARLNNRR
ncbi:flagellar motor switch protein FliN [Alcaligenaceae bacterium CGII-47]|nr:flagellar motor switch protein FliN [Alcaligenaceae bacterium CGII-47]